MNKQATLRGLAVLTALTLFVTASTTRAHDKQQLFDAITQAARAYWEQRVVIEHPEGTFYGYSGKQTVVDPANPADRYYASDSGWIPEPHIFQEWEDSKGHPGVGFAFVRAYEATEDEFLKRAAKSLGDTLVSAQRDNDSGGWWYDMGVVGYDRQPGSPTYRQTRDYGRWVNYFPWGGHGNVMDQYQKISTFDGVSHLCGYFLLRLYQALPADDTDREKYLQSAKWLADTIVGFKDVRDPDQHFHPYSNGGIPQVFPYSTLKSRVGVDASKDYPYDIPHNLMPTLNDDAMIGALFFLIEFWQEAQQNPSLDEDKYLAAIRLNVDYLMDRFDQSAKPNRRGSWASQYWVNDGSPRAGRPTWGRAMEPPAVGFFSERADEVLVKWHRLETDAARKRRIEDTLTRFLLYWKYDAPPVNSRPEWCAALADCPYYNPKTMGNYDPENPRTWWWWLWYNHDPRRFPGDVFVSASSRKSPENASLYTAYYGDEALILGHYNRSSYPMIRNSIAAKFSLCLVEEGERPSVNFNARQIDHYFGLDTEVRFFGKWENSPSRVDQALGELDASTGFFLPRKENVAGTARVVVHDDTFCTRMRFLAWGFEQAAKTP